MKLTECKYFKKYKAIYPPRCGCDACNKKYKDLHPDKNA